MTIKKLWIRQYLIIMLGIPTYFQETAMTA